MIHDKSVNYFASLSIYAWSNEGHGKAKLQLWTTCRHQEKQKASSWRSQRNGQSQQHGWKLTG